MVTGVREALAARAAAALALIDLGSAGPHCYSAAALLRAQIVKRFGGKKELHYQYEERTLCILLDLLFFCFVFAIINQTNKKITVNWWTKTQYVALEQELTFFFLIY